MDKRKCSILIRPIDRECVHVFLKLYNFSECVGSPPSVLKKPCLVCGLLYFVVLLKGTQPCTWLSELMVMWTGMLYSHLEHGNRRDWEGEFGQGPISQAMCLKRKPFEKISAAQLVWSLYGRVLLNMQSLVLMLDNDIASGEREHSSFFPFSVFSWWWQVTVFTILYFIILLHLIFFTC